METERLGPVLGSVAPVPMVQGISPAQHSEMPRIPAGFPTAIHEKMAWVGADFARETQYIQQLSEGDLAELENALAHFNALELDGDLVSAVTFPLPALGPKLDMVSKEVHEGRGFGVVRGLNPAKYSVEDLTIMYLGIQAHVADQRGRQDSKGNMLVHIVADKSSKAKQAHHRHSTKPITFHTEESGDIVSWLTRNTAATGGKCIIASAYAIYNALATSRPDVIRTLARADWPFAMPRFQCRPVLFNCEGKIMMAFGRTPLMGSESNPRPARLPSLTPKQVEALDLVEAVARAVQLEIATQPGDVHFINNLAVLHRREGFVNADVNTGKRHLVRMRLRHSSRGWPIPGELNGDWFDAFDRKDADRVWHIEPMPEGFFPLRAHPN